MDSLREKTNGNNGDEPEEEKEEKTAFPLKWVFYLILGYAFLQTFYFWYQTGAD